MVNKEIDVAFAVNQKYFSYLTVAITSLLENKNNSTNVNFHILINDDVKTSDRKNLSQLVKKYTNTSIRFITFSDYNLNQYQNTIAHISNDTYARLLLPKLLSTVKKCIYLDVDIVVLGDLAPLMESLLISDNNLIAGVLAPGILCSAYQQKRLNELPSLDEYINAGVLVMNLEKMRGENIVDKFLDLAENKYQMNDQDVINIACYGHIKPLPIKYNIMTKHFENYHLSRELRIVFKSEEICDALTDPVIVHFANEHKPWEGWILPFNEDWWFYAAKTPEYPKLWWHKNVCLVKRKLKRLPQKVHSLLAN